MVISFLQIIGHLPNLQDPDQIRAAGLSEQRLWVRPPTKRPRDIRRERSSKSESDPQTPASPPPPTTNVRVSFDTTFVEKPLRNFIPSHLSLSTALAGFFYYYSTISNAADNEYWSISAPFDYETSIISIKHGGHIARDDLFVDPYTRDEGENWNGNANANINASQPLQWREQLLITQDPFIVTRNTSTNVRSGTSRHIIEEFVRAYELISSGRSYADICQKRTTPFQGEPGPGSFRRPLRKTVSRRKKSGGKDKEKNEKKAQAGDSKDSKEKGEKDDRDDKDGKDDKEKKDKEKEAAIKRKRKARKKAISKSASVSKPASAPSTTTQTPPTTISNDNPV